MHDEKDTFFIIFIIFKCFLLLSTMWMHAQVCVRWSKYTTVPPPLITGFLKFSLQMVDHSKTGQKSLVFKWFWIKWLPFCLTIQKTDHSIIFLSLTIQNPNMSWVWIPYALGSRYSALKIISNKFKQIKATDIIFCLSKLRGWQ